MLSTSNESRQIVVVRPTDREWVKKMRLLFVLHHSATPSTTKQVVENARSIYAKQSISFVANVVRNGVHHQVCSLCAKLKIHSFSFSHCTPGIEFCNICLASEFSRFTPSSVCMQFFFFRLLFAASHSQYGVPPMGSSRACVDRKQNVPSEANSRHANATTDIDTRSMHKTHCFPCLQFYLWHEVSLEPSPICSWHDESTKNEDNEDQNLFY